MFLKKEFWLRVWQWLRSLTLERVLTAFLPILLAALLRFIDGDELRCCALGQCREGQFCDQLVVVLSLIWAGIAIVVFFLLLRVLTFDERRKEADRIRMDNREKKLAEQQAKLDLQEQRQQAEADENKNRINQGFRSIGMVPNLAIVVDDYARIYRGVQKLSQPFELKSRLVEVKDLPDASLELENSASKIRDALALIAQMTQLFGIATHGRVKNESTIHANLMLPFEENDVFLLPEKYRTQSLLPHLSEQNTQPKRTAAGLLRFADQGVDLSSLDAVLVLRGDLIATTSPPNAGQDLSTPNTSIPYDVLALPVREYPTTQILPGAPAALVNGGISVHRDTSTLAQESEMHFPEYVSKELAHYFSDAGQGRKVKSFFSVRLGDRERPVAVLSIDSNKLNLIGTTDDQSKAYLALLVPMLAALTPMAEFYAKVWKHILAPDPENQAASSISEI